MLFKTIFSFSFLKTRASLKSLNAPLEWLLYAKPSPNPTQTKSQKPRSPLDLSLTQKTTTTTRKPWSPLDQSLKTKPELKKITATTHTHSAKTCHHSGHKKPTNQQAAAEAYCTATDKPPYIRAPLS